MRPEDDPSRHEPSQPRAAAPAVRRWQVRGVAVLGAVAVLTYLCSLLTEGPVTDVLRTIATVAAVGCALVGMAVAVG